MKSLQSGHILFGNGEISLPICCKSKYNLVISQFFKPSERNITTVINLNFVNYTMLRLITYFQAVNVVNCENTQINYWEIIICYVNSNYYHCTKFQRFGALLNKSLISVARSVLLDAPMSKHKMAIVWIYHVFTKNQLTYKEQNRLAFT